MQDIKDIYSFYASQSSYPFINRNTFFSLATRAELIDKKTIFSYTMDMMFSAVNYDATGNTDDNPNKELVRYEFVELIIRIAKKLYADPSTAKNPMSIDQAIHRVLDHHLMPVFRHDRKLFTNFRNGALYTVEVTDLFATNRDNIKNLIKHYCGITKKTDTDFVEGCLSISDVKCLLKASELNMTKRHIAFLFGMSKQTVIEDNTAKGIQLAENLTYPEFLEFVGRLALLKFLGSELEDEPLVTKIGYILDEMF